MNRNFYKSSIAFLSLSFATAVYAQTPIQIGGGSIASFPPSYKAKTIDNSNGFNATAMMSRKIYADELPSQFVGALEVPGRCLPTNDWWTDLLNNQFSGALWSYPSMLKTGESGLEIYWPSYWADQGKEIKSRTHLTVSAKDFRASAAIASDWHDWDVEFRMPSKSGRGQMQVTSMHGGPVTWVEYESLIPRIEFSDTPEFFNSTDEYLGIRMGDDLYGLYFPKGSSFNFTSGRLDFDSETEWLAISLLRSESDLKEFGQYAVSIPRSTRVDWSFDETSSIVTTEWKVEAQNLRKPGSQAPVMLGFLPHAHKYAESGSMLSFADEEGFHTPRGKLKLATSVNGEFRYSYRFSGMLPVFAAPTEGEGYSSDIMERLMADYASGGSFGGDTYWGGKGLVQMAMNMWFAKLTGKDDLYQTSRRKLRETFENWLTYSPGENTFFFSYYPRWGGMLGFDVSYDSDAFNDHHFHYGYFTYAAALLCLEDRDFADKYGEILTMIAKDYANWDRNDNRFPFMRTLDLWNGHSWAGGLGDHGNDNGNGQESSSEAMQGWGGLYLLGVALDNKDMRDAGIWGWSTEARATREYWYDVDAPRNSNAGGRKSWPGKGDRQGNYNYEEYPYAYNSNITGKGIGWWTWFGGDPLYMHGIQWMPVSPALDYLSWDTDFSAWAIDDMLSGANSTFSHSWFDDTANTASGERIEPLAANDWGNVALSYLQRSDPRQAADIFDKALAENLHIATSVSTGHISYYTIHSHLTYGDPDFSFHADMPTAQVCRKNGVETYIVYNPESEDRIVNFFNGSGARVKTVTAPAGRLTAITADPVPAEIEYVLQNGNILPPGSSTEIKTRLLDQYGAGMKSAAVEVTLSAGAPASLSGNVLRIDSQAELGSKFTVNFKYGNLSVTETVTVNESPKAVKTEIKGVPFYCERSQSITPQLMVTDQYGGETHPEDTEWTLTGSEGATTPVDVPLSFPKSGKFKVAGRSLKYGAEDSTEIVVTPALPEISRGATVIASSAENAGTMPEGLCDGDPATRWGSAHTDDEWVVVDLGEDCFVSRISLLWEAAYASRYLLQMAPDESPLTTMSVSYAGQQKQVSVPQESVWATVADVSISSPGEKADVVNSYGRYIRMKGVSRATSYGYSIYELSVYGINSESSSSDIIGIDFSLPVTLDCNESYEIQPQVVSLEGKVAEVSGISWSSDREAQFRGNVFTPLESGMHTVTATLSDGISTQEQVFVNEVERPVSVELENDTYTMIEGERLNVPFTVMNQFMAPFTGDLDFLKIKVTDPEGNPLENAIYDPFEMIFTAAEKGEYIVWFGEMASCKINVVELREVNLALQKPSSASSAEGNNISSNAFDGKDNTRWESAWVDDQWLEVNLDGLYRINRAVVHWEGAYAKSYTLSVSTDGENWSDCYSEENGKGGTEAIAFAPVLARYVRLNCKNRALQAYGFSVWEMEIYGLQRLDDPGISTGNVFMGFEDDEEVEYYNLQGLRLSAPIPGQPVILRRKSASAKIYIPLGK